MTTSTHRGSGSDTRARIERSGAEIFRQQGFDASTLEDIAAPLGITRAAVLHHYGSKVALLEAIVAPIVAQLDELLDRMEARGPLTPRQQRDFLAGFVDLTCDNRAVAAMVIRDITVDKHLPPQLRIAERAARFAGIVMANNRRRRVGDPSGPGRPRGDHAGRLSVRGARRSEHTGEPQGPRRLRRRRAAGRSLIPPPPVRRRPAR